MWTAIDEDQILDFARTALANESDPQVLPWLASALGHTRNQAAIPDLVALVSRDRAAVRFAVAGSLSMCAEAAFEAIAEPLLALSSDPDDDVRWSAAFKLGEWLAVSDEPRIHQRLAELANDPASEVRSVASGALAELGDSPRGCGSDHGPEDRAP